MRKHGAELRHDWVPLLRQIGGDAELSALYGQAMDRLTLGPSDYATALELCRLAGVSALGAHALLLCLFIALEEGVPCLPLTPDAIASRLRQFLEGPVEAHAAAVLAWVQSPAGAALVTAPGAAFQPLVREAGAGDESWIAFQRQQAQAARLRECLEARLPAAGAPPRMPAAAARAAMDAVLVARPVRSGAQALSLNQRQQLAVATVLHGSFTVISGGPGTGKTAVVSAAVRALLESGLAPADIVLAAPTGRAARRMTESLLRDLDSLAEPNFVDLAARSVWSGTLHRLLEYDRNSDRFRRHTWNPLTARAVIVDEVSMIHLRLMVALLEAAAPDTRLVLIGDPDQLPPVEVGEVLADLLRSAPTPRYSAPFRAWTKEAAGLNAPEAEPAAGETFAGLTDRLVVLTENYRATAPLQHLAAAVRVGDIAGFERIPAGPPDALFAAAETGGFWLPADDADQPAWPAIVDQWLRRQFLTAGVRGELTYFQTVAALETMTAAQWTDSDGEAVKLWRALFARLTGARMITAVRQGPFGSDTLNRFSQQRLQQLCGRVRGPGAFPGMPLLVLENDVESDLYNGDLGIWMTDRSGLRQAVFATDGGVRALPETVLPATAAAFAMTIHKSQGSEFDRVLAVLPDDAEHRLLRRDLLYTAVTRARQSVTVYATKPALTAALAQNIERRTPSGWLWAGQRGQDANHDA